LVKSFKLDPFQKPFHHEVGVIMSPRPAPEVSSPKDNGRLFDQALIVFLSISIRTQILRPEWMSNRCDFDRNRPAVYRFGRSAHVQDRANKCRWISGREMKFGSTHLWKSFIWHTEQFWALKFRSHLEFNDFEVGLYFEKAAEFSEVYHW
jgi:hypothetical protein